MHIPVLLKETVCYLDPKENENFIDATLGQAGHSQEILKRNGPLGKVLGIEQDQEILKATAKALKNSGYEKRIIIVNDNFVNLKEIAERENFLKVKGIIITLEKETEQSLLDELTQFSDFRVDTGGEN